MVPDCSRAFPTQADVYGNVGRGMTELQHVHWFLAIAGIWWRMPQCRYDRGLNELKTVLALLGEAVGQYRCKQESQPLLCVDIANTTGSSGEDCQKQDRLRGAYFRRRIGWINDRGREVY